MAASTGHRLGQIIGDWWEQYPVFTVLSEVASRLDLFLDNRYVQRDCRGSKIEWKDVDNNIVDYDFAFELGGTTSSKGTPVGFAECFWRRGARHSKDKARDDTNKLRPMRDTYPTARFLSIAACGDFTTPAREYVLNNNIELFYIPKITIIEAFSKNGLIMDYPDKLEEEKKAKIVDVFEKQFTDTKKNDVWETLKSLIGQTTIDSYVNKVFSKLSATALEIRFIEAKHSAPVVFDNIDQASEFLEKPTFSSDYGSSTYIYEITYSDGFEFVREVASFEELKQLHNQVLILDRHMNKIISKS